jgi:hypothetical protein
VQLATGLTAACDYDFGTAWRFWELAEEIAQSLGQDYCHPWNDFGPVISLGGMTLPRGISCRGRIRSHRRWSNTVNSVAASSRNSWNATTRW